jgi:transcriptional regulator
MLKAIVGVEISIDEIQCKYKLSQNRPAADQQGVIDKLDYLGSESLAQAMRKTPL